jgi:hypothetical protein
MAGQLAIPANASRFCQWSDEEEDSTEGGNTRQGDSPKTDPLFAFVPDEELQLTLDNPVIKRMKGAASNRELPHLMAMGVLRGEYYARTCSFLAGVPPLNDLVVRLDEILNLVGHLLKLVGDLPPNGAIRRTLKQRRDLEASLSENLLRVLKDLSGTQSIVGSPEDFQRLLADVDDQLSKLTPHGNLATPHPLRVLREILSIFVWRGVAAR